MNKQILENQAVIKKKKEKDKDETRLISKPGIIDIDAIITRIIPENHEKLTVIKFAETLLSNMAKEFELVQGIFYLENNDKKYVHIALYAYTAEKPPIPFSPGETLPGQAVKNKKVSIISDIPTPYLIVYSGTGQALPVNLVFAPLVAKDDVPGLLELSFFKKSTLLKEEIFSVLAFKLGEILNKKVKLKNDNY